MDDFLTPTFWRHSVNLKSEWQYIAMALKPIVQPLLNNPIIQIRVISNIVNIRVIKI